ncbi:unnamed protein product [Staurois parvus]|uniref:Uncharacterized protein n=1 Tax=Staurois parvus TaxID=386267 RepID=A0ABN9AED3_9NEOB|nr:unnamed protein product [Staurois parvus]
MPPVLLLLILLSSIPKISSLYPPTPPKQLYITPHCFHIPTTALTTSS